MSRHRHSYGGEYEDLLKKAEKAGWNVDGGGNKHFKLKCPNACKCMQTMSTTPSGNNYLRNLKGQLKRATCWEDQ